MSEIDWYLDELFDQLAGTGAAGRRALIEAAYHLRAAATDAMATGLPQDQAEQEAISRFGPAALLLTRWLTVRYTSPASSHRGLVRPGR